MATNGKETLDYLRQEMDKELANYEAELKREVQQELLKKVPVGPSEMQRNARDKVLNDLNNEAQKKLMAREVALDAQYHTDVGGSKDAAEKLLHQDQANPEFNEKSSPEQKFQDKEELKKASFDFGDHWGEASDPKKDIDMDR